MSEVSIIGLGAMGSAIADAFIDRGHDVCVWNRSRDPMLAFESKAAHCAKDAAEAVSAAPLCVVCIDDYTATRELIEQQSLHEVVGGKTLLQVSTGTPREARELESWALEQDARYLDGAILAYPREIGHDALIALAGAERTFSEHQNLLGAMSSDLRYLGDAVGAAAALDVALLSYYVCTHLGLIHGALVCESEGLSPAVLATTIVDSVPSDVEEIRHLGQALETGNFENPGASIGVYSGVLDRILQQAHDASINAEIAAFANKLYKRGMAAGFEDQEVVALIKLLRNSQ